MTATAYFVTGTDTDAGKTYISTLLLRHFAAQGKRVIGMKPIASGATLLNGAWQQDDVQQLMQASNVQTPTALVNPYCFAPAIAPHIAATQAGVEVQIAPIQQALQQLRQQADIVVVEGAGGWLVPINAQQNMADLAQALAIPVILVVGMRLGCINHALLSVQSIQHSGLPLLGWIANCRDAQMPELQANIDSLRKRIKAPCLAVVGQGQTVFAQDFICD
jgi:dethiobiotin synthetase